MTPSDELPSSPALVVGLPPTASPGTSPEALDLPRLTGASSKPLEMLLVLLVTVLAVFLASSPAQNSDLWMHLANGRLFAHGDFSVGARVSAADSVYHGWLYNLFCYGSYSALGGLGLMLFKVLLVIGLVLVLLRLSWAGQGWWIPAVCTALVVLVISTRLLLQIQPAVVSYLFLGLTLWFVRDRRVFPDRKDSLLLPWPLVILFVVWVNTGAWFNLGREVVALVWLGEVLDAALGRRTPGMPRQGWLGLLLRRLCAYAVLTAACLINPSHVYALLPAAELGWSDLTQYPFQWAKSVDLRLSLAYFPLLILGLCSFLLNLPRWRWQQFLPWIGLAVLSAFSVRAVPFFAVLAGPILAWNFQEYLTHRAERIGSQPIRAASVSDRSDYHGDPWQWAFSFARAMAIVLGLGAVLCAWPGWLQGPPYEPRRWSVEAPAALREGAAETKRWLGDGRLGPDPKGLHFSRESAYAFAWFCPEDPAVRDDALSAAIREKPWAADIWGDRMRAAGINHLVVYHSDYSQPFTALARLLAQTEQWPLLYVKGSLFVFGWRDPTRVAAANQFRDANPDFNRLAFHPDEDQTAPANARDAEPREWWEALWKPIQPRTIDGDEAAFYLSYAKDLERSAPFWHLQAWEGSQAAGLVAAAAAWNGPGGLLDAHVRLTLFRPVLRADPSGTGVTPTTLDRMALGLQGPFAAQRNDTSPALLFLAIRAARRSLAANPNDPQTYVVLGECYMRLLQRTRERSWSRDMPELVELRQAQASAALNQAITVDPDFADAHLRLYQLYRQLSYLDLQLAHLRKYVQLAGDAGPPPGVDAEQFRADKERFQADLDRLSVKVKEQDDAYAIETARAKSVMDRAISAMQKGLAGKARDMLRASDISDFGDRGTKLEFDLMLATGQVKEVREWATPEHESRLGAPNYHWLRTRALAASGNYADAEEECTELAHVIDFEARGEGPAEIRQIMAAMISQSIFNGQSSGPCLPQLMSQANAHITFQMRVDDLARNLKREADVGVLRGLLALERGDVEEAEIAFRHALAYWRDEATAASGGGLDFNGRPVAQGYLEWLK